MLAAIAEVRNSGREVLVWGNKALLITSGCELGALAVDVSSHDVAEIGFDRTRLRTHIFFSTHITFAACHSRQPASIDTCQRNSRPHFARSKQKTAQAPPRYAIYPIAHR